MTTTQADIEVMQKNLEHVKDIRVMLGTPMIDGKCHAGYKNSILDLVNLLNKYGIQLTIYDMYGESVISFARNRIVDGFMNSSFNKPDDRLLFIDSDISFQAEEILHMLLRDKDIIAAPCTFKKINWERIRQASLLGYQASELPALGGDVITDFVTDGGYIDDTIEVKTVGCGCMMIKRKVFEKMKAELPEIKYTKIPTITSRYNNNLGEEAYAYFQIMIDRDHPHYPLTEDWYLCQNAQKLGFKIFICPWIKTVHTGNFEYLMDMPAIATFLQKKEDENKRVVADRITKERKEAEKIEIEGITKVGISI